MKRLTLAWLCASACTQLAGIERAREIQGQLCTSAAECDDKEPCTDDVCDAGTCLRTPRADGPAAAEMQKTGDCQVVRCEAGKTVVAADDADVPSDAKQCTVDACANGKPSHTPKPKDAACSENGGIRCDGKGECVECTGDQHCTKPKTCGALKANQCGCVPIPCANVGLTCGFKEDDGCGKALDCNDTKQNGDETDVDCGGSISSCSQRCNTGKKCKQDNDCASVKCNQTSKMCD
jgi:hypothetical protein